MKVLHPRLSGLGDNEVFGIDGLATEWTLCGKSVAPTPTLNAHSRLRFLAGVSLEISWAMILPVAEVNFMPHHHQHAKRAERVVAWRHDLAAILAAAYTTKLVVARLAARCHHRV